MTPEEKKRQENIAFYGLVILLILSWALWLINVIFLMQQPLN